MEPENQNTSPEEPNSEFSPVKKEDSEKIVIPTGSRNLNLKRSVRYLVFVCFFFMNICIELDDGVISANTEHVRKRMEIEDGDLGLIESFVFIGVIIGSLTAIPIMNTFNRKYIIIIANILIGVGVLSYIFIKSKWPIMIIRIVLGFCRAFIQVYLPLWIDQFGIDNKKTLMLAVVQLGPTLGSVIGFGVSKAVVNIERMAWDPRAEKKDKYVYTMVLQTFILVIIGICLFFVPNRYFIKSAKKITNEARLICQFRPSFFGGSKGRLIMETNEGFKGSFHGSIFYGESEEPLLDEENLENKQKFIKPELSMKTKFKQVLTNPLYMCSVLALGFQEFSLGALNYWTADYMVAVLKCSETQITISVMVIMTVTPVVGVIIGGVIIDSIGGYILKKAVIFCFICVVLSSIIAVAIPFVSSVGPFDALIGGLVLVISAFGPPMTGFVICSLRNELKSFGTSLYEVVVSSLGYFPSPLVFGGLKTLFIKKEEKKYTPKPTEEQMETVVSDASRSAMLATTLVGFVSIILLIPSIILRYKKASYYDKVMKDGVEPGDIEGEIIPGDNEDEDVPDDNQSGTKNKSRQEQEKNDFQENKDDILI